MMINEIPFLLKMGNQVLEEEHSILPGNLQQQLRNLSTQIVLVDHFVEVPQTIEQRFDDIDQQVLLNGAD
jgi:hypothetical protein